MREIDPADIGFPLGAPIRPEPAAPPPPRQFNRDGTIVQGADGKLSTNLPEPELSPWADYMRKHLGGYEP